MAYRRCIQNLAEFGSDKAFARQYFEFEKSQEGVLAVRILEPVNQAGRNCWRVQSIFEHNNLTAEENKYLPDGLRECVASFSIIAGYSFISDAGHEYFREGNQF